MVQAIHTISTCNFQISTLPRDYGIVWSNIMVYTPKINSTQSARQFDDGAAQALLPVPHHIPPTPRITHGKTFFHLTLEVTNPQTAVTILTSPSTFYHNAVAKISTCGP